MVQRQEHVVGSLLDATHGSEQGTLTLFLVDLCLPVWRDRRRGVYDLVCVLGVHCAPPAVGFFLEFGCPSHPCENGSRQEADPGHVW